MIVLHDAGLMDMQRVINYNSKLRSAEYLLHGDGSVSMIRRAETMDDCSRQYASKVLRVRR